MGRLLLALAFVMWAVPAAAQQGVVQSQMEALGLSVYTYETLTVSTAVVTLTAAKVTDANVSFVFIVPKDQPIIFTRNGTDPSATYGEDLAPSGVAALSQAEAVVLKMLRSATTDATVRVIYCAPRGTTPIP